MDDGKFVCVLDVVHVHVLFVVVMCFCFYEKKIYHSRLLPKDISTARKLLSSFWHSFLKGSVAVMEIVI